MRNDPCEAPTVLLVDDDPDICRNMSDILTDVGYEVDVAYDGESGLALVRRRPYDVAILDLKMPGMDGLTLYREIKKIRPETAAVIVSAYATHAVTEQALTAGVLQVLPKPLALPQLMQRVEQALGQPLVLIVDDDRDFCANLWDLLHNEGYRVDLSQGENQVAEKLGDRAYDIVLIDMRLADGDGASVFRTIRRACPAAHTVLITGFPFELGGEAERLLEEGADAIHYKPLDVPALLSTIGRLA